MPCHLLPVSDKIFVTVSTIYTIFCLCVSVCATIYFVENIRNVLLYFKWTSPKWSKLWISGFLLWNENTYLFCVSHITARRQVCSWCDTFYQLYRLTWIRYTSFIRTSFIHRTYFWFIFLFFLALGTLQPVPCLKLYMHGISACVVSSKQLS